MRGKGLDFAKKIHGDFSLQEVCCWCQKILHEGVHPMIHGICPECQMKEGQRSLNILIFHNNGESGQRLTWRRSISRRKIVFRPGHLSSEIGAIFKKNGGGYRQEKTRNDICIEIGKGKKDKKQITISRIHE